MYLGKSAQALRRGRDEGLAARRPLDERAGRKGRRLVLGAHAAARRDARAAHRSLQVADDSLHRLAPRCDRHRARAALPREIRPRRRGPAAGPDEALVDRRGLPRRRARELGHELLADVPHGLGRRAHPRRSAQQALPPPPAALARFLRTDARRRDHQPPHERRRGPRPARHGRCHEPRPELAHARRDGDPPLRPRLAARARDADRDPGDERRHGDLPQTLGACIPRRPRKARARHRHARGGHRGHAGRAGVHA